MRPSLNWNWGPVGIMVSLAHGCVTNYAKLLALAYRVLSITIWRKPACNGSLSLDAAFDAMNTSLNPHWGHIYGTFVLYVLIHMQYSSFTFEHKLCLLEHANMCRYGNMEKEGLTAAVGMHPFDFLLLSDLCVVSLHRAITEWLPCGLIWQALRCGWADINAAIVSRHAASCRVPGPHPPDGLMIWHTWSKALWVCWCAFRFSRAPTRTSIDLAQGFIPTADECRFLVWRCGESAWIFHQ